MQLEEQARDVHVRGCDSAVSVNVRIRRAAMSHPGDRERRAPRRSGRGVDGRRERRQCASELPWEWRRDDVLSQAFLQRRSTSGKLARTISPAPTVRERPRPLRYAMGIAEAATARSPDLRPTPTPLHLSVNVIDDWLEAIEFGSVVDGRPGSQLIEMIQRRPLRAARRGRPGRPASPCTTSRACRPRGPRGLRMRRASACRCSGWTAPRSARSSWPRASRFEVSTADVCFFTLALACAEEEGDLDVRRRPLDVLHRGRRQRGALRPRLHAVRPRPPPRGLRAPAPLLRARPAQLVVVAVARRARPSPSASSTRHGAPTERAIRREREGSFRTDAAERLVQLERVGSAARCVTP